MVAKAEDELSLEQHTDPSCCGTDCDRAWDDGQTSGFVVLVHNILETGYWHPPGNGLAPGPVDRWAESPTEIEVNL